MPGLIGVASILARYLRNQMGERRRRGGGHRTLHIDDKLIGKGGDHSPIAETLCIAANPRYKSALLPGSARTGSSTDG
jgi:hypothetical protein